MTKQKRSFNKSFLSQSQERVHSSSQISTSLPQNITCYLLQDYGFLSQYQLLEWPLNSEFEFLARIKSTQQLVRFKKRQLLPINTSRGKLMYTRFQSLFSLYQQGVILADNIFILQQAHNQHFYYIIQPYMSPNQTDSLFLTLQQYLFENRNSILSSFQSRRDLFAKCKNLLDKLSLQGVAYCGVNSKRVLVDDQGEVFLLPFQLQSEIINVPYQRAYYPLQLLSYMNGQQHANLIDCFQNWDIWSFGCIALDIFLYLTPCFLSTSIQRQYHKIINQIPNIFKDFQSEFLSQNNSGHTILSNQEQSTTAEDKQKILNLLMNIFHEDSNKRKFSFQPIYKKSQLLKSERRTSKAKSSIKKLLQKTQLKSIQNLTAKTERQTSLRNTNIQFSRLSNSLSFKELNICEKAQQKNYKLSSSQQKIYSFQIRLKSLILPTRPEFQSNSELKIVINFANGQKFQFFTAFPSQNSQQTQLFINRKITFLQRQQKFIEDLLQQDIQITLSIVDNSVQQEKKADIFINLSALMIKNEQGERLWKKPIKGTYQTQKNSFIQCKLKIEAEVLELFPNQNSLSKPKIRKVQMVQQETEKNFSIVHWLQDTDKIVDQDKERQNITQQVLTSRFEVPLQQQKIVQYKAPQTKFSDNQKKSIYKFSQINSQLDEISTYWRQRISKQQHQQNQSSQDQIIQTDNALKEVKIQQHINREPNQENEGKNLEAKVKKILHQNRRSQKFTEPVDLSKRLKRLLMR